MSDLGVAGINSGANSINDNGQIAGYYEPNGPQPARWVNGVMTDLGNLPGGVGGAAEAINKFGQIVGYANTSGSGAQHAFLYSNGSMSDLGTLGGVYVLSQANALNSQAAVVGASFTAGFQHNHGFLYANGHMTDLGTFPGGTDSEATGINDLGQIIGYSNSSTFNQHGFVITNGVMNDLGVLPGGNYAQPFGINNAGQIVGEANSTNGNDLAFLYQGGVMYELNQLLDGSAPGWVLGAAVAINDKGWITGTGYDPNLNQHAFLLTPVPEPASVWLLVAAAIVGLITIAICGQSSFKCRWRRRRPSKLALSVGLRHGLLWAPCKVRFPATRLRSRPRLRMNGCDDLTV